MTIPRPYNEQTLLSTPLTVLGMFIEIVRARFSDDNFSDPEVPWAWNEDLDLTKIFIESGFNVNIDARTTRPGVWIDRDQNIYVKSNMGRQDQMPVHIRKSIYLYHGFGEIDIMLDCTSPNRGESMVVGSVVQDFLQMSASVIKGEFGLRDMTDVIMNRTAPFDKDDKLWNTQVQVRAQYEIRWITAPLAPAFNSVLSKLSNVEDPSAYFREVALRSKYELDT
jgi:hypothetical protein